MLCYAHLAVAKSICLTPPLVLRLKGGLRGFKTTICSPDKDYHTHYDTLGVKRNATSKEIKDAYLKLSKELHPDKLSNDVDDASVHEKFVALNEAYTVLGKSKSKKIYDLGLPNENAPKTENPAHQYETMHYRPMTFSERAHAFGYTTPQDPNYYKRDRQHVYVFFGCIVFVIFGAIIHFTIARMAFEKHQRTMTERTAALNKEIEEKQERAKKFNSNQEIWDDIMRRSKNSRRKNDD